MSALSDLKYTRTHEWIRLEGHIATIGITDHAQSELGDVVYVELPEPGRILQRDEVFGTIESIKAVSDLYSPLSGEVVESNGTLTDASQIVNDDPFGGGWMIKLRLSTLDDVGDLLTAEGYEQILKDLSH